MRRIFARFTGDFTRFERRVDCTDEVLSYEAAAIRGIKDHDFSSDHLVPENIVEQAQRIHQREYGRLNRAAPFGFEVEVVASICWFFGVESIAEITDEMVDRARAANPSRNARA